MTSNALRTHRNTPGNRVVELLGRARPNLRNTAVRLWDDDIADYAAARTYCAVLALVPALLVSVSRARCGSERRFRRPGRIGSLTSMFSS